MARSRSTFQKRGRERIQQLSELVGVGARPAEAGSGEELIELANRLLPHLALLLPSRALLVQLDVKFICRATSIVALSRPLSRFGSHRLKRLR